MQAPTWPPWLTILLMLLAFVGALREAELVFESLSVIIKHIREALEADVHAFEQLQREVRLLASSVGKVFRTIRPRSERS